MRIFLFAMTFGLLSACIPAAESRLSSSAPGDTFAAIGPDSSAANLKIWLSSKDQDRLGLCILASATESCDKNHASYLLATKVHEKNGRRILGFSNQVPNRVGSTYVVVTEQGTVQAKFVVIELGAPDSGGGSGDPLTNGLAMIQKETLRKELSYFASDDYNGRLSATPENDRAADWLISQLKELGIEPGIANYRQSFRLGVGPTASGTTSNIIAKIEGSDPALKDEYVVIGAHMDHTGTLQRGYTCSAGPAGDSICNGADDNGSGSIAVLNVAKALAAAKGKLKRSVLIMWFSGEEEGLIGSYHYVRNPVAPIKKTVYMINMDMVGYMKSNGNNLYALGGGTSSTGSKIMKEAAQKYSGMKIQVSASAGGGSDHVPFLSKGIPGVFFHTGVENNRNYHRTGDNPDKIDYDGMTVAAKIAFETVYKMANSAAQVTSYAEGEEERQPLVTEEEMTQSCHHLIKNPFVKQFQAGLDFTNGNDGGESSHD